MSALPTLSGKQLRNRALAKHAADPIKADFYKAAQAAVLAHLAIGPATIEQCLAAFGVVRPPALHPNSMGAIAGGMSRADLIRRKGVRHATGRSRKAGMVMLWELA